MIGLIVRATTYASLFIGVVLVWLPKEVAGFAGLAPPAMLGLPGAVGAVLVALGAALALWCVVSFLIVGRGTPAPFDPPRRLVMRGPYHFVRNPMYLGAGMALIGAALSCRSGPLVGYALAFLLTTHLFVIVYEEPALLRRFGSAYEAYRRRVGRWHPRFCERVKEDGDA